MARYALNSNGFHGWVDIEIGEKTCTGKLQWDFDPKGTVIDQSAEIANGTVDRSVIKSQIIEFDREPYGQHFKGWLSEDGRVIAGFFTRRGEPYQKGWYATRYT